MMLHVKTAVRDPMTSAICICEHKVLFTFQPPKRPTEPRLHTDIVWEGVVGVVDAVLLYVRVGHRRACNRREDEDIPAQRKLSPHIEGDVDAMCQKPAE